MMELAGTTGMSERSIRQLTIAVLLLGGTAPVFAADMPVMAPIAIPAYDWSGFYAGVNLGYSVSRNPTTATEGIFAGYETFGLQPAGVVGGVQAGYNCSSHHIG